MGAVKQAEDVDWDRLDKQKFFVLGAGMFSGVTTVLYPLTVIKTKQMTLPGIGAGLQGARQTASTVYRQEGVAGFYRGFGTVICGTIPARVVYLTTLEWVKSEAAKAAASSGLQLSEPTSAGLSNFAAGLVASMAVQTVTVPIDVISQKQMVHGAETVVERQQHQRPTVGPATPSTATLPPDAPAQQQQQQPNARAGGEAAARGASEATTMKPAARSASAPSAAQSSTGGQRIGALQLVRVIIKEEGVAGLYRGFAVSVATYAPSSAVWWSAYGTYQKLIWGLLYGRLDAGSAALASSASTQQQPGAAQQHSSASSSHGAATQQKQRQDGAAAGTQTQQSYSTGEVMAVQTLSSVLAGCTSSLVTTPLDLIKTRIQVAYKYHGAPPTVVDVARQILREDGPQGFLRGAAPRMVNASLWGTCMVTVYEFLKRVCQVDVKD